jgi:hypothetical protein
MKKLVFLMIVGIGLIGCATVENNDDLSPFEGEWKAIGDIDGKDVIFTYVFTGNQFELTRTDGKNYTGTFKYSKKKITFSYKEYGNFTEEYKLYELPESMFKLIDSNGVPFTYFRTSYFKTILPLLKDEKGLANFSTNESELASIQGLWKIYNTKMWNDATYTFSKDNFTLTTNHRDAISGTVKVNENVLIMIVDNKPFGIFLYEFRPNNVLFFHCFYGHSNSYMGTFYKKQIFSYS